MPSLWAGLVNLALILITLNAQVDTLRLTTPFSLVNHVRHRNSKPPVVVVVDVNKKSDISNIGQDSGHYHSDGNYYDHGRKKTQHRIVNYNNKKNREYEYTNGAYRPLHNNENKYMGSNYKNTNYRYAYYYKKKQAVKDNKDAHILSHLLKDIVMKDNKNHGVKHHHNEGINSETPKDLKIIEEAKEREMKKAHLLKHILMAVPGRLSIEKLTSSVIREAIVSYKNCVRNSGGNYLRGAVVCFPNSMKGSSCETSKEVTRYTVGPGKDWGECYQACDKKKRGSTKIGHRGTGRTMPPALKNKMVYSD